MMTNSLIKIRHNYAEFIFVLYIFIFALIKPISQPSGYSGILLLVSAIFCIVSLLLLNLIYNREGNYILMICSTIIITLLLLWDLLFRYNENTLSYYYNYLIYGGIPLFFIANVKNFRAILWYYTLFSIITGFIYLPDPFNNYNISGGYMQLGFSMILPAFCGAAILWLYYKKRIAIFLVALFLLFSLIFANKSSTICSLILLTYLYISVQTFSKKKQRACTIVLISIVLFIFRFQIFNIAIQISDFLDVGSYSLATFNKMLTGDGLEVYILRYDVWDEAIMLIKQKPICGWGPGWFEQFSIQPYPHNLFLQILLEYGIIGFFFFITVFIISLYRLSKKFINEKKIFISLILIMWFCPLFVSLSYWSSMNFWVYFGLVYTNNHES